MTQPGIRSGTITVDFLTPTHRISAQMTLRGRVLADVLNDVRTSFLPLEAVFLSRLEEPARILKSFGAAILSKNHITMAIVNVGVELAVKAISPTYGTRKVYGVFVTIPGFEIEGTMEFHGRPDLHALLVTNVERFLPILNAQAVMTGRPESRFSGELIFINRDFIGLFSLSGEVAQG
ncbi:hypothetical protein [Thermoflexus hugenholtzii]|uniref:hypothetical protein n=1 Tax=Thermoflexus hugenholtzii TaxID=1495650 RepID=UPI00117F1702|nr:hypothetical protein [Thermoflexus hugenholtzii]